jgi:ABC-type antimicrobial peptide transport system permease subunit
MPITRHRRWIVFGRLVGLLSAFGLNYISYIKNVCPVTMDDCGWSFGFPSHFYLQGGFVTFREIIWFGLVVDILFALGLSLAIGFIAGFIWSALTSDRAARKGSE